MSKRLRGQEDRLTREDLEAEDYGQENQGEGGMGRGQRADPSVLQNRKIVKVKRHVTAGKIQEEIPDKPTHFKLAGGLSLSDVTAVTKDKAQNNEESQQNKSKNLFQTNSATKATFFAPPTTFSFAGKQVSSNGASGSLFEAPKDSEKKTEDQKNLPKFQVVTQATFAGKTISMEPKKETIPEKTQEKQAEESKPKETEAPKEEKKPVSLFGGETQKQGGLFGVKPAGTSLFGQPPATNAPKTGGLFSNLGTSAPAQDASQKPTGGLFGNAAPSTSLFGSKAPTTGGLFGAPKTSDETKPTSLFGAKTGENTGGSLFGNGASSGGSLFNQYGLSLHSHKPLPWAKSAEEVKKGEESEEEKVEEEEPQTVVAQNTKSPYEKVFDKRVDKVKVVKPEDQKKKMTGVNLSIETAETDGKKVALFVARSMSKTLFMGIISAKISKIRQLEEAVAKNRIKVAVQIQIDTELTKKDGTKFIYKKPVTAFCEIDFPRTDEMTAFESEFKKAVEWLKDEKEEGEKK